MSDTENKKFISMRIIFLLALVFFIIAYNNNLILKNIRLQDRVTLGDFILNSRIVIVFVFAFSGALIIRFLRLKKWTHLSVMGLIFVFFGVLPAFSDTHCFYRLPSPLCSFIKPLIFVSNGVKNIPIKFIVVFVSIVLLSLLGSKLFCGWVCPVGVLQEAVHSISSSSKKRMLPFKLTNYVRIIIFALSIMLALLLGLNLYFEFLNPFIVLRWRINADLLTLSSWTVMALVVGASIYIYKPYCYLICPIGLLTWLLEHVTLARVVLNENLCDRCDTCVDETNCPSVKALIMKERMRPDCFSCGRCIASCPRDALEYRVK